MRLFILVGRSLLGSFYRSLEILRFQRPLSNGGIDADADYSRPDKRKPADFLEMARKGVVKISSLIPSEVS